MVRFAGMVAGALLLSGCAVTSPLPGGLTESERLEFTEQTLEDQWDYMGISDRERPVVVPIEVDINEAGERTDACLADAGFAGVLLLDEERLAARSEVEVSNFKEAFYVCTMSFMPPARYWGYLSTDELNATYDYFQDWLVPCLESRDYHLPLAPERQEVASAPGYLSWDPYTQLGARITDDAMAELQDECPTVPPWLYE